MDPSSTPSTYPLSPPFFLRLLARTEALLRDSIFHPSFNVDLEDAQETIDRFERHVEASDKSLQGLRETFARFREGEKGASQAIIIVVYLSS